MAIFRRGKKLFANSLKRTFSTAVYQDNNFPLIELHLKLTNGKEGRGKKNAESSDIEEVVLTMTLFEANEMLKDFQLIVSNTTRLSMPRNAVNIPWAEGSGA